MTARRRCCARGVATRQRQTLRHRPWRGPYCRWVGGGGVKEGPIQLRTNAGKWRKMAENAKNCGKKELRKNANNCGKIVKKIAGPQPNLPKPQRATILPRWLRIILCLFKQKIAQNCEKLRIATPPPPTHCPMGSWPSGVPAPSTAGCLPRA